MKSSLITLIVISLAVFTLGVSGPGTGSKPITYTILVEATGSPNQEVNFTAAYTAYDENANSKMTTLEKRTPYEAKVSGAYFVGMFQSTSGDSRIKVTLTKYEDGVLRGHADGSGVFNFLHGEPNGVGYGVPEYSGVWSGQKDAEASGK